MSETVQSLFLKARALLDQYSEDGVLLPDADVVDMQKKSILLADMAQKELYKIGRLYKTFEFANKPAPNLMGNFSNFDIVDFIGTPQYYPNETGVAGAKAYYVESDGDNSGTNKVEIEENQSGTWTVIKTDTFPASVTALTAYKGLITPISSTNAIRMKISGTTHFRHCNRCFYSYPFAASKIPAYRPWFPVEMPADFRTLDQVVEEYPTRQYSASGSHKWEESKYLYVNYYYEGNIRVVYKPVPTTLTTIDSVLEIDDITAQGIVYYIAARLAPFGNKSLVNFFEDKFIELKVANSKENPASEEKITDYYGGSLE